METKLIFENWKPVNGFENLYEVSNLGIVKSIFYNKRKNLKLRKSKDGYDRIMLYKDKKPKTFVIHRLVAIAFIPNPENKSDVNHINGIKDDNRVQNLEWTTRKENMQHALNNGLIKTGENHPNTKRNRDNPPAAKKVIDLQTGEIFSCIKNASENENYNFGYSYLAKMLKGKRKNITNLILID